ncbi:MAG: sulfite exporter TauE/SafE family protein [Anaerolineae bacterium]|nr:sulfite exporter TauE/SafE family protein [Anaerolineae bacterium]
MKKFRLITLTLLVVIGLHLSTALVLAHPLGNFTINQYAGLLVQQTTIEIDFVLDMAEIPAYQEIALLDTNHNGRPDAPEVEPYTPAKCEALRPDLQLDLNGRPLALILTQSAIEFAPGAGGLPTLRLSCQFSAPLPDLSAASQVEFRNTVYAERLGWREIVVAGDGVGLDSPTALNTASLSQRLTQYPQDLLNNPPDQRQIFLSIGTADLPAEPAKTLPAAEKTGAAISPQRADGFTESIKIEQLTLPAVLLALVGAFGWGAAHALTPGHGKTIVAAYLIGARGTARHALFLGVTTTITHTFGVFMVGFLTLFASRFILPEQLYPWLGVLSGVTVVWIGLSMFRGRLLTLKDHHHSNDHHHHHHDEGHHHHHHDLDHHHHHHHHDHDHYHLHSHLPPGADGSAVTWRSLLALGISGGLLPCPSALIVMLSAIALQRIGFGLLLVIAFSLGLAGVLTAIGIMWVQARQIIERAPQLAYRLQPIFKYKRWWQIVPAMSALVIAMIGLGVTLQALAQTGVLSY